MAVETHTKGSFRLYAAPSIDPGRNFSARSGTECAFAVTGMTCFVHSASHRDISEAEVLLPRHAFVFVLEMNGQLVVEESWDAARFAPWISRGAGSCTVLPRGQRYIAKMTGRASQRYIFCEVEHSTFVRVLGERLGDFELRPGSGPNPMAPGIVERLASLCATPDRFPAAYAEALASMLVVEMFRASGTKPIPPELTANVGSPRFKLVLDFVEESLDRDIGLDELASVAGLSITHFSHAFKTTYGISPYRYIMQRRVRRAGTLLRTTNDTVATIASRVGFASQSRFSQAFASLIGSAPSAYRSAGNDG
jgi:AraC-like DNA-binding protein